MMRTTVTLFFLAAALPGFLNPVSAQAYGSGEVEEQEAAYTWPDDNRMALSLTFDDARFTQIDSAVPLMDQYDVDGTFYVRVHRLMEKIGQWQEAVENGHEVANHTINHSCSGNFDWSRGSALEDYTLSRMDRELDSATHIIEDQLGVKVYSFAYPCGMMYVGEGIHTRSYVPLVAEKFQTGRAWLSEASNDPLYCNLHQLYGIKLDGLTPERAIEVINASREKGDWLVFVSHETRTSGDPNTLVTYLSTIEAICKYATDPANGIWIDDVHTIASYVADRKKKLLNEQESTSYRDR